MANIKNLKPFTKGTSGNPKGRPPVWREFKQELQKIGMEIDGKDDRLQKLARMLWNTALAGDLKAAEMIMDRIEGRPQSHHKLDTGPTIIRVKVADEDEPGEE